MSLRSERAYKSTGIGTMRFTCIFFIFNKNSNLITRRFFNAPRAFSDNGSSLGKELRTVRSGRNLRVSILWITDTPSGVALFSF